MVVGLSWAAAAKVTAWVFVGLSVLCWAGTRIEEQRDRSDEAAARKKEERDRSHRAAATGCDDEGKEEASFAFAPPPSSPKARPPRAASAGTAKASPPPPPPPSSAPSSPSPPVSSKKTSSSPPPPPPPRPPPSSAPSSPSPHVSSKKTSSSPPPQPPPPQRAAPAEASLYDLLLRPSEKSSESPQFDRRNKSQLPRYEIPKHLRELIEKDVVPQVLKRPVSPSTYADYFAALLHAEDFYREKWCDYLLLDVALELRKKEGFKIRNSVGAKKNDKSAAQMDKPFVAFEIDSVPEKRPYLLSRDHVLVRPAGRKIEPFQGVFFRVEKSKWVLAEFGDDFHKQHSPSKKYNVSFSFNRVCLKRAHQAVSAAMDPFLCSILFPDPPRKLFHELIHNSDFSQNRPKSGEPEIISRILNLKSPQPYLIEGPLSQTPSGKLSDMGNVIQKAILQLYRTYSSNRILVCAPRNRTLDAITGSLLMKGIPESRIFRANAAFRDFDLVPGDIMPACLFEGECFACPPLAELKHFRVVTSTYISTFRLYAAGIGDDHFTHIFLVDASSSTEPETIVALANLVGKTTAIVATGSARDSPAWVRSDMARRNGLKKSFFQRLLEMEPYSLHDPMCIAISMTMMIIISEMVEL